jgi:hypothetical protein
MCEICEQIDRRIGFLKTMIKPSSVGPMADPATDRVIAEMEALKAKLHAAGDARRRLSRYGRD